MIPTKTNWGNAIVDAAILLDILATMGYAYSGDWKKAAYWFFATCLTVVVRIM